MGLILLSPTATTRTMVALPTPGGLGECVSPCPHACPCAKLGSPGHGSRGSGALAGSPGSPQPPCS